MSFCFGPISHPFPYGSAVQDPPRMQEMQETWVRSLGREDPLEEEIKSLLMKVKEENEKAALKLSIQKTKIMAVSPITS